MPGQCPLLFTCYDIPKTDDCVTTTYQRSPIRAEFKTPDSPRMLEEDLLVFTCSDLLQTDGLVPTSTCDRSAIRTKRKALNPTCVPGEGPLLFTCHNIP
jgi:hypothetical protein